MEFNPTLRRYSKLYAPCVFIKSSITYNKDRKEEIIKKLHGESDLDKTTEPVHMHRLLAVCTILLADRPIGRVKSIIHHLVHKFLSVFGGKGRTFLHIFQINIHF